MRWMVVLLVVIVAILLIIIGVGVIYSPVTSDTQDVQQETFGDDELIEQSIPAVSYTHLTLPTISCV